MKFLIIFICAIAAVSAGYVAPVTHYTGAQHIPVINHEGVPVDTAEVQHATAAHLAHQAYAHVRNGDIAVAPVHHVFTPGFVNGVPLETPEVVAAKANHFAAHSEALARTGYPSAVVYRHRRGIYDPPTPPPTRKPTV